MAVSLESSASNDPQDWRSFPPTVLKKHTCVFETQPVARNAEIADALFEQGYEDVICVQIVGRSTKVTFRTLTTLNRLCETELFYFRDSAIPVRRLITALTEIQILDVPVWVEVSTIVSALSIYGKDPPWPSPHQERHAHCHGGQILLIQKEKFNSPSVLRENWKQQLSRTIRRPARNM